MDIARTARRIAGFASAHALVNMSHINPAMRVAVTAAWPRFRARFAGRIKCPCELSACSTPNCPLCLPCENPVSEACFALMLAHRESEEMATHVFMFEGLHKRKIRSPGPNWDGRVEYSSFDRALHIMRGDVIYVDCGLSVYLWDGHCALPFKTFVPATFRIPTEFPPEFFISHNNSVSFAFHITPFQSRIRRALRRFARDASSFASRDDEETGCTIRWRDETYILALTARGGIRNRQLRENMRVRTQCRATLYYPFEYRCLRVELDVEPDY